MIFFKVHFHQITKDAAVFVEGNVQLSVPSLSPVPLTIEIQKLSRIFKDILEELHVFIIFITCRYLSIACAHIKIISQSPMPISKFLAFDTLLVAIDG